MNSPLKVGCFDVSLLANSPCDSILIDADVKLGITVTAKD